MYQLIKDSISGNVCSVILVETSSYIPFDPANTDYQNFKAQILAEEAELQDADGVTMSAQAAIDYVKTLP